MRDLRRQQRQHIRHQFVLKAGEEALTSSTLDLSKNGARVEGTLPNIEEGSSVELLFQVGPREFYTAKAIAVRVDATSNLCVKFSKPLDTRLLQQAA